MQSGRMTIGQYLPQTNKHWTQIVGFAVIYFIAARIGFLLPFEGEIATLIWPASSIALAVLLLYGIELWPAITLGALAVAISNQHSPQLTLGVLVAHTLEPALGAYALLRLKQFNPNLDKLTDVVNLLLYGVLLSPAIGATIGILSFSLSPEGASSNFALMWWHWWIAHAISFAFITPLILTTFAADNQVTSDTNILEYLLILGSLAAVSMLVFIRIDFLPIGNLPLGHVVFPFLLWIALRFTPREVATAGFMTVSIAIIGTINKTGPFSRPSLDTNLILLATFVFAVVIMALMLASLIAQRRQAHHLLEQRVLERTSDLQVVNEQLQEEVEERKRISAVAEGARDDALRALQIKNQILANVSHDARTPINIVMLYADLILRSQPDLTESQHQEAKHH